FLMLLLPLISTLFPYTTLFRSKFSAIIRKTISAKISYFCPYWPAYGFSFPFCLLGPHPDRLGRFWLCLADPSQGHRGGRPVVGLDRKSTRLNSSHVKISYAVFC